MRRVAFMKGSSAIRHLRLRLADLADTPRLKSFYLDRMRNEPPERQEAFPIPTLLELTQAAEACDSLLIETVDGRDILAASGIFRLVEHDDGRFGELSGMCTAKEIGGLGPRSIQEIMLAVRVVRALYQLLDEAAPTAIVSFVETSNRRSWSNLVDFGLEGVGSRPNWLDGEFVSWFGWSRGDDWGTYRVGRKAVETAAAIVLELEASGLAHRLGRTNLATGERETFVLNCDRGLWAPHLEDLRRIRRDGFTDDTAAIPESLSFARERFSR